MCATVTRRSGNERKSDEFRVGPLGEALLVQIRKTDSPELTRAFAKAVLQMGGTTRRSVTRFGVNLSKRQWIRCRSGRPSKLKDPALIASLRACLEAGSQPSGRLRTSKGDRKNASGAKVKLAVRTLRSSKTCILARNWGSLKKLAKRSTLFKLMRTYLYEYAKSKRRTDRCDICWHYDHKFLKHMKVEVSKQRSQIEKVLRGYFAVFDAANAVQDVASDQWPSAFSELTTFLDKHCEDYVDERHSATNRVDLHAAEAAAAHSFRELQAMLATWL